MSFASDKEKEKHVSVFLYPKKKGCPIEANRN